MALFKEGDAIESGSTRRSPWLTTDRISYEHFARMPRTNLAERCSADRGARLTLVQAPAGFGKTTLLAHLAVDAANQGSAIAWVSVDATDDLASLYGYLRHALQAGGLHDVPVATPADPVEAEIGRLTADLLNAIGRAAGCWCIFVDDADRPRSPDCRRFFNLLIRFSPPNLKIVLSSREDPQLETLSYEIDGTLRILGPADLRLSEAEMLTVCPQAGGQMRFFLRHSDGWPAALAILRNRAAKQAGPIEIGLMMEALDAASRQFMKHIVAKLPANEREFIRCVMLVGTVYPEMAEAFGEGIDAARIRELCLTSYVLTPSRDQAREAFTVHPLVSRSWEQRRIVAESPAEVAFCRTAAEWMYRLGKKLEPIRLASMARDKALAIEFFEKLGGLTAYFSEGVEFLPSVMSILDDDLPPVSPRLLLAKSLLAMKAGQLRDSEHFHALATWEQSNFPRSDNPRFEAESDLLYLLHSQYACEPIVGEADGERVRRLLENSTYDPALRGCVTAVQCVVHFHAGNFQLSRHFGEAALESARRCRARYEMLHIHFHLAAERISAGDVDAASSHIEAGGTMWREHFADDRDIEYRYNILKGSLHWELGQLAVARKFVRGMLSVSWHVDVSFDLLMVACRLGVDYLLYFEGSGQALRYLEQMRSLREGETQIRAMAFIDTLGAMVSLRRDGAGSVGLPAQAPPDTDEDVRLTWREREAVLQWQVRQAAVSGDRSAALAAGLTMLDVARKTSNKRLHLRALVEIAILEVAHHSTMGDSHLSNAVQIAQSTGYIWPLLENFDKIDRSLASLGESMPSVARLHGTIRRIAGQSPAELTGEARLTVRQREVLTELCNGATDKQIARTLKLSPNGVRYHLKAIYTALGVRDRAQAVRSASELDLL